MKAFRPPTKKGGKRREKLYNQVKEYISNSSPLIIILSSLTCLQPPTPNLQILDLAYTRLPSAKMLHPLHRYDIELWSIFTPQHNPIKISWEDTTGPLASCRNWLRWRNNHEHIVILPNDSHHTHSTAFLDIPVVKRRSSFWVNDAWICVDLYRSNVDHQQNKRWCFA